MVVCSFVFIFMTSSCKEKIQTLTPPTVTTLEANSVGNIKATLNAIVNPNGKLTSIKFEYGITLPYDSFIELTQIASSTDVTVSEEISGLISGVTYHFRVVALNEDGTTYGEDRTFITTVKDGDGNNYNTKTIGTQTWLLENLKTTKLHGGSTIIPCVTNNTEWLNLTTLGYCWYNNDINYKNTYGALYNEYAVNTGRLCPIGWHVPNDNEWYILLLTLDNTARFYSGHLSALKAGGKLKEVGTTHWLSPNAGANNESGFTGLPGGSRDPDGEFHGLQETGVWWSSYEDRVLYTSGIILLSFSEEVWYLQRASETSGQSVRCIRDN